MTTPGLSLSGRNHAFIPLSVSQGSAVVVGSCAFVCLLLPSLLHRLPVLPVSLRVPNDGRAVMLVPGVHRERTLWRAHCTLGGQNIQILTKDASSAVRP